MPAYLFPVEYKMNNPWDTEMIQKWTNKKLPLLTFAFNRFFPHTLTRDPFWLYLYYTKSSSEDPRFKGKLRYRFQVIDWQREPFKRPDTFVYPSTLDAKVWFLCNRFEEVASSTGGMLAYEDFQHLEGKSLASSLRSSIAPAICQQAIRIVSHYP